MCRVFLEEINIKMFKESIICCIVVWYFLYYSYFIVRVGLGVFNVVIDTEVINATCNGNNSYDYCPEFMLSYVSSIVLFIIDLIIAIAWLCFIKIAVNIVRNAGEIEKAISEVKLENNEILSRISEKNDHILALQGQLADRGLFIKATEQLENALTTHAEGDGEKARLLPQNKSPKHQAFITSVYNT